LGTDFSTSTLITTARYATISMDPPIHALRSAVVLDGRGDAAIEGAVADGTKRTSPAGLSRYVTATARRGALAARLA
jgi:hypothetical protein